MADRFSREEQEIIRKGKAFISQVQTGGVSDTAPIDRDFLMEDGNADFFFLNYFPRDFLVWEPLNIELMNVLENQNQAVCWLPGTTGKTTTLRHWMIYVMCREPQIAIIYCEKTDPTAKQAAHAIMTILETNDGLIRDFGEFKGDLWSTNAFTIRQRPVVNQWPTAAFFGAGGSAVLGKRCNICIVDDPVTSDNSCSELERSRLLSWYNEQPATAPSPLPIARRRYLKKLFLVGTTFHMDDLFHRVLEKGGYHHLWLEAVDMNTGDCLAPNRFCWREPEELKISAETSEADARLLKRITEGDVVNLKEWRDSHGIGPFMKRFQNRIVDPSTQRFPLVMFEGGGSAEEMAPPGGYPGCYDYERSLAEPKNPDWRYVIGVDPAAGTKGRFTVRFSCCTLGWHKDAPNNVYLVDLDYGKQPMVSDNPGRDSQVDIVLDHAKRYGGRIILETNNVQGVWAQALRTEAQRRGQTISISGHFTSDTKKLDPNQGIEAMVPTIENGDLRIPYKLPSDRRKVKDLVDEFVYHGVYPTDDVMMSFWFAWRQVQRFKRSEMTVPLTPRAIKPYMHRGDEWRFPPEYTPAMIHDFHNKLYGEPQEAEAV